jgi:inorganic pyrophosphatase
VDVQIDAPRFSFVKRDDQGAIDFVSPLPCPFNYGSVLATRSGDGERVDALVLGARRPRGIVRRVRVVAIAHFVDAGELDPKWICAARPLDLVAQLQIDAFFLVYARAKRVLNRARGRSAETRYDGIELLARSE